MGQVIGFPNEGSDVMEAQKGEGLAVPFPSPGEECMELREGEVGKVARMRGCPLKRGWGQNGACGPPQIAFLLCRRARDG